MQYTKLCQIVDTVKFHIYHGDETTQSIYDEYVSFVESLKTLKEEAQLIHHTNNDMRFVNTHIGGSRFRVMATTVRGFAITIQNQDVSISLKSLSAKHKNEDIKESNEYLLLTPNPVMKVEFRASYLARVGHSSAMNFILKLIEHHVLSNYIAKISELHLATDIQGYNFDMLDFHRFKTRKRKNSIHDEKRDDTNTFYYQGRKFTGFTFGQGDEMLRIYNKTVEIKKNPDKAFIKHFAWENNPDYDEEKEVWRIEIQYRREKLKTIYDSKNGLLDGFVNVLDSLGSLWNRALEKVELTDLKHDYCLDAMLGYYIVNDIKYPIETNTINMRMHRAETHDLWNFLKGWHNYEANETNVYNAPKTGAFQWVSNSIKSLLSTTLKYEGDLSGEIIRDAFNRADIETKRDKKVSLVDNAYLNTMSYLGEVEINTKQNGVYISNLEALSQNVADYVGFIVREVTKKPFHTVEENVNRMQVFNKAMNRYVV